MKTKIRQSKTHAIPIKHFFLPTYQSFKNPSKPSFPHATESLPRPTVQHRQRATHAQLAGRRAGPPSILSCSALSGVKEFRGRADLSLSSPLLRGRRTRTTLLCYCMIKPRGSRSARAYTYIYIYVPLPPLSPPTSSSSSSSELSRARGERDRERESILSSVYPSHALSSILRWSRVYIASRLLLSLYRRSGCVAAAAARDYTCAAGRERAFGCERGGWFGPEFGASDFLGGFTKRNFFLEVLMLWMGERFRLPIASDLYYTDCAVYEDV